MPPKTNQEDVVAIRLQEANVTHHFRKDKSGVAVRWKNWFVNEGESI
jgi:hypothetical protein